jgi:hypothetical protein
MVERRHGRVELVGDRDEVRKRLADDSERERGAREPLARAGAPVADHRLRGAPQGARQLVERSRLARCLGSLLSLGRHISPLVA